MHSGQLHDATCFSRGDLLIPDLGAGDGLQDGHTTRIGGDIGIANDEAQCAALLDVAEVGFLLLSRAASHSRFRRRVGHAAQHDRRLVNQTRPGGGHRK